MNTGTTFPHITLFQNSHADEVVGLILHIQNVESKVGISIEDQPELLDIHGTSSSITAADSGSRSIPTSM